MSHANTTATHDHQSVKEVLQATLSRGGEIFPAPLKNFFAGAAFLGFLTLGAGFAMNPQRAWLALLVNLLFFTGLAQGGIVLSAAFQITNSTWGRMLKRFGEAMAAFLPVSFILFLVLTLGVPTIYPWVKNPIPEKTWWLNLTRFYTVDYAGILLMYGLSFAFLYYVLRVDVGVAKEKYQYYVRDFGSYLIRGWKGTEAEVANAQNILGYLAPFVAISYGLVFSLFAFDFVMSLDPHWYSTLFGMYFFVGNFYVSCATVAILAAMAKCAFKGTEKLLAPDVFHDLGKLTHGFSLMMTYMFWAQFKVIWYANIPEELPFVMIRTSDAPWKYVSWVVITCFFVIPFILFIFKNNKAKSNNFRNVAFVAFFGVLLERYLLVYPSIFPGPGLMLGGFELLVSVGFLGLFMVCVAGFLSQVPIFPVGDPIFEQRLAKIESAHH